MFNVNNRCSLSEFARLGRIIRDGTFYGVAKIPSRVPARLVPVSTRKQLEMAVQQGGGISGIICPASITTLVPDEFACIEGEQPQLIAQLIHAELAGRADYYWTGFPSKISSTAKIHPDATVAANDVEIGDDVVVEAGAIILERSIVGSGCEIGAGTIIGTKAFELVKADGRNRLLTQVGGVRIGRDSMFLSGAMVARSAFASFTEIGENCAFDNLVHIAHDCVIGDNSQVTAGAILAGRVTIGAEGFVGPNSTVSNGVTMGPEAQVSIGSMVVRDVEPGLKVTGYFATDHRQFLKSLSRDRG